MFTGLAAELGLAFLAGGGEMGERVRRFDWATTTLGPIAAWPQSLRTAVGIVLLSPVPIVMLWGEDGIMIYNDAYSEFAGGRHPRLLGSKVREGWPEVADFNDNVMRVGLAGGTLAYRDQELTLYRHGKPEQVWMNLDYSPILDESGKPAGVMAIVVETTERVLAERDRARAVAALRESEEQLRLATEAAEVGLWDVDVVTGTLYWPPRVKAMFGISPEVPVSMADFYAGLHPDDRERVSAAFAAALDPACRALYDVEYRTIGKEDGVERWVAAKGRGFFDAAGRCIRVLGTAIDITERERTAQKLRELNETLERRVAERTAERDRVWRNSRDLLVIHGADGVFRAANPAWETILGYRPGDVIGRSFREFVWPEDIVLSERALADAAASRHLTGFENRFRHVDGTPRWVSWHTAAEGDLVYAYGRDITAEKEHEAQLAAAQDALRQAQKMEAVGQLTGGIAHDFNSLLQGVTGNLDLIVRNPMEPGRVRRLAEGALHAAERGTKLTGQLLAFSRAQRMEAKPVIVSDLVAGMSEMLAHTLGPMIQVKLGLEAKGVAVRSDPTQLEMALLNLAINARDAMPKGGELTIATRAMHIARDIELEPGDYLELRVTDTGSGMTSDVAARAFDPFFTTKRSGRGTGLGLSQVYGVARQGGGTARIATEAGKGTTVSLYLPQTREPVTFDPALAERWTALEGPSASVLVIDDDDDVRRYLHDALETLGFTVALASDGVTGLAALERATPDVLLVDFAMPGLNGAEIARAARAKWPALPIIFASGYAETAAIDAVPGAGPQVLRKPFRIAELRAALSEVTRHRSPS